MLIKDVEKASGVSSKLIRYYEEIGLINQISRNQSGYRIFSQDDILTLKFIKKLRDLNFSLEQIKNINSLWKDKHRKSSDVKDIVLAQIDKIEKNISQLQHIKQILQQLTNQCIGDEQANCFILQSIEKDL